MSKPNGRQKRAIENLAAALNECFEAAVEAGENRTKAVLDEALDAQNKTLNEALDAQNRTLNEALDAQNKTLNKTLDEALSAQNKTLDAQTETLRMIWQQCGGRPDQRLPIDK